MTHRNRKPSVHHSRNLGEWIKGRGRPRRWALNVGGRRRIVLAWVRAGGSGATMTLGRERYTLKRVGFFSTRISIRSLGSDVDLGYFTPSSWGTGGRLEFDVEGAPLTLRRTSVWKSDFKWYDSSDRLVMTVRREGTFKTRVFVELGPDREWCNDAYLLAAIGWYVLILMDDDAAAIAGATVVIAASG